MAATQTTSPTTEGKTFEEALTNDDIEVIALGLRAISQVTPNQAVIVAFNRLAEVLERMRK